MNEKQLLATIANPVRLRLIRCLSKKAKNVQELINTCALSQSAVSQHLAKLRKAKLVKTTRQGAEVYYSLASTRTAKIAHSILSFINQK
jgi:ArsR family transcriptional regulator